MKELIELIKEDIRSRIKTNIVKRQTFYKQDELLCVFAICICEMRKIVDYCKENNFKENLIIEHEQVKELEKEVRKLRKENKRLEKENK